jgi:hypothetical protein
MYRDNVIDMRRLTIAIGAFLLSFSASAELLNVGIGKFSLEEAMTGAEAIARARETVPRGYADNSSWTSPIISCELGYAYDEATDTCESSLGERAMVAAMISVKAVR